MKIITRKDNHTSTQQYRVTCTACGSELEFDSNDIQFRFRPLRGKEEFVACPVCTKKLFRSLFVPYPPPTGGSVGITKE